MSHTLVVLRHAKSDWPVGVPDHDRPLGRRGRADAGAAGRWLAEHVPTLDRAVVSTARRTRETWELAGAGLPAADVRFDDRVYDAAVEDLLAVLRETDEGVRSLALVGHNPSVQLLVLSLAGSGSDDLRALAETKYPTSGLAVLDVDGPWAQLRPRGAVLEEFVVPRG